MSKKELDIEKLRDKQLEHMLEEWKVHNEYVNTIDVGYQSSMVIMLTVFTALIGFLIESENQWVQYCILLIPLGIEGVLAYVSYQFRIVAILRGHLESLELEMNEMVKKDVHSWNSALVETYMARNNLINQCMMGPICALFVVMAVFCFFISRDVMWTMLITKIIFVAYWLVVLGSAIIIFVPFCNNEKVRRLTSNRKNVWKDYRAIRRER